MASVNIPQWTERQNKMANAVLHHYFDRFEGSDFIEKEETSVHGEIIVKDNQISFTVMSVRPSNKKSSFHNYRLVVVGDNVYIYYKHPQSQERSRSYVFTDDKSLIENEPYGSWIGSRSWETYFLDKSAL